MRFSNLCFVEIHKLEGRSIFWFNSCSLRFYIGVFKTVYSVVPKLNEFHLHTYVRNQSTFYHHDGKSKSQIDYIIANDDVIESITFFDQDHLNSSTDIPVKTKLSSKMATMKTKTRTSCTAYKLLWNKTDRQEYENTFNCILTQHMDK